MTALATIITILWSGHNTRKITTYRIDKLEEAVNKHNQVIERVYKLEQKVEDMHP